jgi:hypothetical protein
MKLVPSLLIALLVAFPSAAQQSKSDTSPSAANQDLPQILAVPQETSPNNANCKVYFSVIGPDGRAVTMTKAQADWFSRNGPKKYPTVCYIPSKANYWLMLSLDLETEKRMRTVTDTVQAPSSGTVKVQDPTTGQTTGTGTYDGSVSLPVTRRVEDTIRTNFASITIYEGRLIDGKARAEAIQTVSRTHSSGDTRNEITMLAGAVRKDSDRLALEDALKFLFIRVKTGKACTAPCPFP